MKLALLALTALLPLLGILFFRYFRAWPHKKVMLLISAITIFLAATVWQMPLSQIAGASVKGIWMTLEVVYILLAGIFMVQVWISGRMFAYLRVGFSRLTQDRRIQAILVGWFLGSGLENILGFGMTGSICAVILGGLGFPPACALMMGVMGPMVAGAFSTMGLPANMGTQSTLTPYMDAPQLTHYMEQASLQTAMFQGIAGTWMPLLMVLMISKFFGRQHSWLRGFKLAPFALFCGAAFTIPYMWIASAGGIQFAALGASVIGFALAVTAIGTGFLIPKEPWKFISEHRWSSEWLGGRRLHQGKPDFRAKAPKTMSFSRAFIPLVILVFLTVITRLPQLPLKNILKTWCLEWEHLFGSTVNVSFYPLFSMGTVFLVTAGLSILILKPGFTKVRESFGWWAVPIAWLAVTQAPLVLVTACIYAYSDVNFSGHPGMPHVIAIWLAGLPGSIYFSPFLSPFIGAVGSFFGANNTFSNAIFSNFQYVWERELMMPSGLFVSLQMAGAAAGNMVSLRYLAGAGSPVGMLGWSAPVGRKTAIPMVIYLTFLGGLGVLAAQGVNFASFLSSFTT